jgi:hypothetical protein
MPSMIQIALIGGILLGILFIVWKLVSTAKNLQKEADQQKARADTNESAVRGLLDANAMERDAQKAADEARKNAKSDPTRWL